MMLRRRMIRMVMKVMLTVLLLLVLSVLTFAAVEVDVGVGEAEPKRPERL